MRVFVETVADVLGAHEQLDLIDLVLVKVPFRLKFLDLLDALFLGGRDFKLIFVAPEDARGGLYSRLCHQCVKVHDLKNYFMLVSP